ncbi:hypothetical protein ACFQQB_40125 [Nonomuraea rubra]|uniref:hypothetical protein n=1 Tax=Nonomuraea rubra TaxID=46180 RepID=UPI003610914E
MGTGLLRLPGARLGGGGAGQERRRVPAGAGAPQAAHGSAGSAVPIGLRTSNGPQSAQW